MREQEIIFTVTLKIRLEMFKNFFVLNRHVSEVNNLLSNATLVDAFTQEKNKLVLYLRNANKDFFIEINTDSLLPYFIVKEQYSRAKKNTLSFFDSYLPSKINSVKIANFDRVIQINLKSVSIYFYFHGKDTNVFLIDERFRLESFKKIDDEQKIIDEIKKLSFTNSFQTPQTYFETASLSSSQLSKKYQYLGREIADELSRRTEESPKERIESILMNILEEIKTGKPFVFYDQASKKSKLSFFYRTELNESEPVFFENVNNALKYYIAEQYKQASDNQIHKNVQNKFEKNITQLEKKIAHLQARIKEGSKDSEYFQIANLLQMNSDKIERGSAKIELKNTYDSEKFITIKLLPNLSPRENINYYFNKAKSERKEFDKHQELLADAKEELKKQSFLFDKYTQSKIAQTNTIIYRPQNLKKGDRSKSQDLRNKFRQFILYDKYLIFVGKNSKNNDELTTGFAKQNDTGFMQEVSQDLMFCCDLKNQ